MYTSAVVNLTSRFITLGSNIILAYKLYLAFPTHNVRMYVCVLKESNTSITFIPKISKEHNSSIDFFCVRTAQFSGGSLHWENNAAAKPTNFFHGRTSNSCSSTIELYRFLSCFFEDSSSLSGITRGPTALRVALSNSASGKFPLPRCSYKRTFSDSS